MPEHVPLEVQVHQSTLARTRAEIDDFFGFEYRVTNRDTEVLEQLHVGFFAD